MGNIKHSNVKYLIIIFTVLFCFCSLVSTISVVAETVKDESLTGKGKNNGKKKRGK